jgi:hypothetical protein
VNVPVGLPTGPAGTDVLGYTYRLNPGYEVVPAERLSAGHGVALADADSGRDFYGVLLPRRGSGLEPRSISADTALLALTLQTPGPLPAYSVRISGPGIVQVAHRLVFDGVLQILHGGDFVSGPAAAPLFAVHGTGAKAGDLAVAALKYAQELTWLNERELSFRIYCYGRQPVTPALYREVGPASALKRRLGLDSDGPVQRITGDRWRPLSGNPEGHTAWWQWSRTMPGASTLAADRMTYKLYVSPSVSEVAGVLESVAALLATCRGPTGFKVGAGVEGICRPDKIVVYFPQFEDLQRFGWALEEKIRGCPAHGVPFSADVSADGLLTWGIDPPAAWSRTKSRRTSWRMWLAGLLAEYLLLGTGPEPADPLLWQFALNRLRLSGIDTDTWIPAGTSWMEQ